MDTKRTGSDSYRSARRSRSELHSWISCSSPPTPTRIRCCLLSLLAHNVRVAPTEVSSLMEVGNADVAIVDARTDLAAARGLCRLLGSTGSATPVAAVLTEGGLVAVNADWGSMSSSCPPPAPPRSTPGCGC